MFILKGSSSILNDYLMVKLLLYIYTFKRLFLNLKGLSDGKSVSLTKKEYGSEVHFLKIFMKP